MPLRPALLLFQLHTLFLPTAIGSLVAVLYVLLAPDVLDWRSLWPYLFVGAHSILLGILLGRTRDGAFVFLYTRGYSRDSLWGHAVLAGAVSIVLVWLPAALLIWTNLRSVLQDRVVQNPFFPVMAPLERSIPLYWLAAYILLVPTMYYAWVRAAQPTRGRGAGHWLAVAAVSALLTVAFISPRAQHLEWLLGAGIAVAAGVLLVTACRLHRQLEVGAAKRPLPMLGRLGTILLAVSGSLLILWSLWPLARTIGQPVWHLRFDVIVPVVVVGMLAIYVSIRRYRQARCNRANPAASGALPETAAGPAPIARLAEGLVLLVLGGLVLGTAATNSSTGGLLLVLGGLPPNYVALNLAMFGVAGAILLLSAILAWLGRTAVGVGVVAVVLCGYGIAVNGGSIPGQWFVAGKSASVVPYTIDIMDADVTGADLWVNGVHLGCVPYTTTLDEFQAKVPYWADPPADYETDVWEQTEAYLYETASRKERHWIQFSLPDASPEMEFHGIPTTQPRQEQKRYYARVRYAGEWGVDQGGSGAGVQGGRLYRYAHNSIGVMFPERQRRLDALLSQARLANCRPSPQWFQAIETYNSDGWQAIYKAAEKEPQLLEVLDAWATWRYDLDKVRTPAAAQVTFERILAEADQSRQYNTASPAGRAVERILPLLPVEPLIERAEQLIASFDTYGWSVLRPKDARLEFGTMGRSYSSMMYQGDAASRLPARAFPVAQAIRTLHEHLEAQGAAYPNIVQQRVSTALVRHHWSNEQIMGMAAWFGGPAIDTFLVRKYGRMDPDRLDVDFDDRTYVSVTPVNRWLWLLAHLRSPAGRECRRQYDSQMLELARHLLEESIGDRLDDLDFLFLDSPASHNSLALRFWPIYRQHMLQKDGPRRSLDDLWKYLVRLGPAAPVEMYLEVVREKAWDQYNIGTAVGGALKGLPEPKRAAIATALLKAIEAGQVQVDGLQPAGSELRRQELKDLQRILQNQIQPTPPASLVPSVRKLLERHGDAKTRERISAALAMSRYDLQDLAPLAMSQDTNLQLLVIPALRDRRTLEGRQILADLAHADSASVQAAAQQALADLAAFAAADPMRFASASQPAR